MKRFYIMESTKANKNGHVSHLFVLKADGVLYEISPLTGKEFRHQDYHTLKDMEYWGWKIVKPEDAQFVGACYFPFFDYIKDNFMDAIAQ